MRARTARSSCSPASRAAAKQSSGSRHAPAAKPGPGSASRGAAPPTSPTSRSSSTAASATPYKFTNQQATTQRRALPAGDYGIAHDGQIVAVVERKSLADLTRRLIDGQLTYALAELAAVPRAAVVVEDRYSGLFKLDYAKPGFVVEMLAALAIRYPAVPIIFCETRPLAEEWSYRYLGAGLAYAQAGTESASP